MAVSQGDYVVFQLRGKTKVGRIASTCRANAKFHQLAVLDQKSNTKVPVEAFSKTKSVLIDAETLAKLEALQVEN